MQSNDRPPAPARTEFAGERVSVSAIRLPDGSVALAGASNSNLNAVGAERWELLGSEAKARLALPLHEDARLSGLVSTIHNTQFVGMPAHHNDAVMNEAGLYNFSVEPDCER